jgi:hypothetical protein
MAGYEEVVDSMVRRNKLFITRHTVPAVAPRAHTPVCRVGHEQLRRKTNAGPVRSGTARRIGCPGAVAAGFEPADGVNRHTLSRRAP